MLITLVDNGSKHIYDLQRLAAGYGDVNTIAPNLLPESVSDLTILSGSHVHSIKGSQNFYHLEAEYIRRFKGPILGICAGMQLIVASFGQPLGRLDRRIGGQRLIELTNADLRMTLGGKPQAHVSERHGWGVPGVTGPLESLARSITGVEVVRHHDLPIIGLQFHPELPSPDGEAIFGWAIQDLLKSG